MCRRPQRDAQLLSDVNSIIHSQSAGYRDPRVAAQGSASDNQRPSQGAAHDQSMHEWVMRKSSSGPSSV